MWPQRFTIRLLRGYGCDERTIPRIRWMEISFIESLDPAVRNAAFKTRRNIQKERTKAKNTEQLRRLASTSVRTKLMINGQTSSGRQLWLAALRGFGAARFGDRSNTQQTRPNRLTHLGAAAFADKLDDHRCSGTLCGAGHA